MVRLKDIAEAVGTSTSAVSYALSGRGSSARISPDRVREITEAAMRMGYRANAAARSIKMGSFSTVALVLGSRWGINHIPGPLLDGVMRALEERHLRMLVAHLPESMTEFATAAPMLLRELTSDGLLVTLNESVPPELEEIIVQLRIPTVWVNDQRPFDAIYPDERTAARIGTRHLLALGHRRLAYAHHAWSSADTSAGHFSVGERLGGFHDEMQAAGLQPIRAFVREAGEGDDQRSAFAAAMRSLSAADRPTAVLTYSGGEADTVLTAAIRLGLSLPRDLSVVTFSDQPTRGFGLDITTLRIPLMQIGVRSVTRLVERIAEAGNRFTSEAVLHELIHGESCVPPPLAG